MLSRGGGGGGGGGGGVGAHQIAHKRFLQVLGELDAAPLAQEVDDRKPDDDGVARIRWLLRERARVLVATARVAVERREEDGAGGWARV